METFPCFGYNILTSVLRRADTDRCQVFSEQKGLPLYRASPASCTGLVPPCKWPPRAGMASRRAPGPAPALCRGCWSASDMQVMGPSSLGEV